MSSSSKKKVVAPTETLEVYMGEHDIFVKVPPANSPELKADWWATVQKFYRLVAAKYSLQPKDIWDGHLGYAVLPLKALPMLEEHFHTMRLSEGQFVSEG